MQILDVMDQVTVTFVVNVQRDLLIADRRSEHVVCAGGEVVLSAGEMIFELMGNSVKVVHVTSNRVLS